MIDNSVNLLAPQLTDTPAISATPVAVRQHQGTEFNIYFKQALDSVNELQSDANKMRTDYELGATDDLASVMIASHEIFTGFSGTYAGTQSRRIRL